MANTFRGEVISVAAPTVQVADTFAHSITFNPGVTASVKKIDAGRVLKYKMTTVDTKSKIQTLPVMQGLVTVTITCAADVVVFYSLNGRNPTYKGVKAPSVANDAAKQARLAKYNNSMAKQLTNGQTFTMDVSRPGGDTSVIRLRAHKLVGGKVSPNEKSPVVIIEFSHINTTIKSF